MEKYAQIPLIKDGVVFSDPSYKGTVWCQYRKAFTATDWLMKMKTHSEDGFISLQMVLGRPTVLAGISVEPAEEGLKISYPGHYDVKDVALGMDTASIFCGTKENWNNFAFTAPIHTGTDGLFGDLMVFTCKGEKDPAGFLLTAGIDEIFMRESELIDHFFSSFNGREMTPEMFASRTDSNSLAFKICQSSEIKHFKEALASKAKDIEKGPER